MGLNSKPQLAVIRLLFLFVFLAVSILHIQPAAASTYSQYIVADYHLDECAWEGFAVSGRIQDVMDSGGKGLHGYAVGSPVSMSASSGGGGVVCRGAYMEKNDYFYVADNNNLDLEGFFTIMVWVKPKVLSGTQTILRKGNNYMIFLLANGKIQFQIRTKNNKYWCSYTTKGKLSVDRWTLVTARYTNNKLTVYLNKRWDGEAAGFTNKYAKVNGHYLQIGNGFAGAIDEVLIFKKDITTTQIRAFYDLHVAKKRSDGSTPACTPCEPPSEEVVISTTSDGGQLGNPDAVDLKRSSLVEYTPSTKKAKLVKDFNGIVSDGWNAPNGAHIAESGDIFFSAKGAITASGDPAHTKKIYWYDKKTVEVLHDFSGNLSGSNAIDALYLYETADAENTWNVLFSTSGDDTWQQPDGTALSFQADDLVLYVPSSDKLWKFFDGSRHFNSSADITGVHVFTSQHILLATESVANLGALPVERSDIVLYSPFGKVGSRFFDGSAEFIGASGLDIDSITVDNSPTPAIDHYEILHDGSALTCGSPEEIVIYACEDEDCTTYSPAETTVTLTVDPISPSTATTASWVGGDDLTFTESGIAKLKNFTAETVAIGMKDETIEPVNDYYCVDTIGGDEVDCEVTFHDSGFEFAIPSQTSCKQSVDIEISAVGTDPDNGGACVPRFEGRDDVSVGFYSDYVDPSAPVGTPQVKVNGTAVSTVDTSSTAISLDFNDAGKSTFKVSYPDAGKLTLNAKFEGVGDEAGLVMKGEDDFVVHPAGFCVYTDEPSNECESPYGDCSKFWTAGEEFTLKVKAVCWEVDGEENDAFCKDNTTTPNFKMTGIGVSHSLVAPSTGSAGTIDLSTIDISTGGEAEIEQVVSEVGVFTFTADPVDDYLGDTEVYKDETFKSANIGRFIPDHFKVEISPDPPEFDNECSGVFTYLGQPFNWDDDPELSIVAMNGAVDASGDDASIQTANYEGDFWKLDTTIEYKYEDKGVPTSGTPPAPVSPLTYTDTKKDISDTADVGGKVTVTLDESNGFIHTRPSSTSPVAPFDTKVTLTVPKAQLTDSDGVCYEDSTGCIDFTVKDITGALIRHGQPKVEAVYGPETGSLVMPVSVLTYSGTEWILSSDDGCTEYGYVLTPSGITVVGDPVSPITISGGFGNITLTASPAANSSGTVLVEFDFPDWLHPDPSATATFGISRGNDRVINWQESVR